MVRNARLALLATVTVVLTTAAAQAGSLNSYGDSVSQPSVSTYAAGAPAAPQIQPYYDPAPETPVAGAARGGYYDPAQGNNEDFGYQQSHACGGAVDGEKCLVILNDHMRRVRLDRDAGTILVGNPTIADVTVLGNDTMFVSARSIGSTNIIALDKAGNEIATYEVFVREPRTKRVVLRNAGIAENYQCAPHCERALTQSDSLDPYKARRGIVASDISLDQQAIGLQSGVNPNADPQAAGLANAAGAVGGAGGGIAGAIGGLGQSAAPGSGALGSIVDRVSGFAGGGGASAAPARTDAPPLAEPN